MKRAAAFAAVALLMAVGAGAASGQIIIIQSDGAKIVSAVDAHLKVSGAVVVDFHGDPAAGCADIGLCGVSGTVVWDPGKTAEMNAFGFREDGVRFEQSYLLLGGDDEQGGPPLSSARVRRSVPGDGPDALCADLSRQSFTLLGGGARPGTSMSVSLIGDSGAGFPVNDFVRTRCAGPVIGDIAQALPVLTISERGLRHGRGRVLDFSGDRPFSVGGMSGTVHSTLKLRIAKVTDLLHEQQGEPEVPTHRVRLRELEVEYRLESLSGQVVADVEGLADPDLCGPLDACGLAGSITATPRAATGEGYLLAIASFKHSPRDLRRALGLLPGGAPKGVHAFGYVLWDAGAGHVTSDLRREGADACTDRQPLPAAGTIDLLFGRPAVRAHFGSGDTLPGADLLRTRCPGPGARDVAVDGRLAGGRVPLSAFARRRVTVRMTRGVRFASDGYRGSTHADVTAVLRRTRIREHVQVIGVPNEFGRTVLRIGR